MIPISMFSASSGERHFSYSGTYVSLIKYVYAKTNQAGTTLTLSCSGDLNTCVQGIVALRGDVLLHSSSTSVSLVVRHDRLNVLLDTLRVLQTRQFIATSFAQEIMNNYPNQFGGVIRWSPPITFLPVQSSDDEEPQHDAKRRRYDEGASSGP